MEDVWFIFIAQDAYAKYIKDFFLGTFGVNVQSYNQKHLKNTLVGEGSSDRLWWFQVCTEVAYFQVAPTNDSMRSSKVDTRQILLHTCNLIIIYKGLLYIFRLDL